MKRPEETYALFFFGLIAVVTAVIWLAWRALSPVVIWLACSTVVTLGAFAYDKVMARSHRTRVPEIVLLALTFFGGTLGALVGYGLFRHKTHKTTFPRRFWAVIGIQVLLILTLSAILRPNL